MSAEGDWEFVQNMVPGMTYVSKSFPNTEGIDPSLKKRFATRVLDSEGDFICERQGTEVVVRQTAANRHAIKALFPNDS